MRKELPHSEPAGNPTDLNKPGTAIAGSGRRYKIWRFMNWDCDKEAPWGCSRCYRANAAGYQFRLGFSFGLSQQCA